MSVVNGRRGRKPIENQSIHFDMKPENGGNRLKLNQFNLTISLN